MNLIFQRDYFPEEEEIWTKYGAKVVSGLCKEDYIDKFSPIVSRGTIAFHNTTKSALKYKNWPDLTWPFNNEWSRYGYRHLLNCGDLLNQDAIVVDFSRGECYLDTPKWLRCESGSKQFTGGIFSEDQFMVEKEYFRQQGGGGMSLVVASPKKIGKEWRLIIIDRCIVTESQYMDSGEPSVTSYVPEGVRIFGARWKNKHKHLFPDSYVLDICETEDGYKVVEVNNLLTSSFYGADIDKIVGTIVSHVSNFDDR